MTAEDVKTLFDWIVVGLAGLTFVSISVVLITGNIINKRQADQLREFDQGLTAAKTELGKQQERAATAESKIALAEQHSAEANSKAEEFRLDIAKANESAEQARAQVASADAAAKDAVAKVASAEARIAEANRAAAEANATAERERLARIQLEARLADRVITQDQKRRIKNTFAFMKGQTVDVVTVGDTPEVNNTADAIVGAIQSAGVLCNIFKPFSGGAARGVVIGIQANASEEIKEAGVKLIEILRETLDGGVGVGDFNEMAISGTGMAGGAAGATPAGQSSFRLQIATK